MKQFLVTLSNGELSRLDAKRFDIDGTGALRFFAGSDVIAIVAPGCWLMVQEVNDKAAVA